MFSNMKGHRVVVTGCAGFIGSHLTDSLLASGAIVVGIDNLSTGRRQFLEKAFCNPNFSFHEFDLTILKGLSKILEDSDLVFHLAANADVRFGAEHPRRDLEQNTIVTHNVLEAMRNSDVKRIIFSSTGSIYGESTISPTPENSPFPVQTSLYGASKLASEGLIQAYCETFDMQSWIFRFVSILGPRYSHGHVFDFYQQLIEHPQSLSVLGNGYQRKSYLHVYDCIEGIDLAIRYSNAKVNIFNLGTESTCVVRDSVSWICKIMQLEPMVNFGTDTRGWIGDNPLIQLDVTAIKSLGWEPKFSIEDGIESTVDFLSKNEWLFTT